MDLFRFRKTRISRARRVQQIITVFLGHGFGRLIDQIRLGRYIPFLTRLRSFGQWPALKPPGTAERLRLAFGELGPSFIKLAQILASRPDLIGEEFADEFRKLQDEVPPFGPEEAKQIIEQELKRPVSQIFARFDENPIAAASIAQVHMATLPDGTEVAVKVQRPGIKEQIETDIEILSFIARQMEKYVSEARFLNPKGVVEEFARTVHREMDFTGEASNCERLSKNFEGSQDVYFPKVYSDYLTEKVIVLERIQGIRIDHKEELEAEGFDTRALARLMAQAYFKMIFDDGFFHADPHPGNLFVTGAGQIAFIDFGIVGRVSEELRNTLANTFISLINQDFDGLIDSYIELGFAPQEADLDEFRRAFRRDLIDLLEPIYGKTLGEIDFPKYLSAFLTLAVRHNLRIPSELLLIDKSLLILQSIALKLDPTFDFMAVSEPYAERLVRRRYNFSSIAGGLKREFMEAGEFAYKLPRNLKNLMNKALRNDLHMKLHHLGLENLIKDMDRSSNRLAFAMVISAMIISGSIMHAMQVPPRIFGLSVLGFLSFFFAGILGIWLVISIIRSGRL